MPYYHVAIAKKTGKVRWAFAFDMSREDIDKEIVLPFSHQQTFLCDKSVIAPSDIEHIRINKTDEPSSRILDRTRRKRILRKIMETLTSERGEEIHIDEWYIIHAGKDVTRELMKGLDLPNGVPQKFTRKDHVFIVHGRDDRQALLLQKYLKDRLRVKAVMFDDLPDKGRTIIEQLEYVREHVYYAFVVVMPDDVGCLSEEVQNVARMVVGLKEVKNETVTKIFELLHERARQNVVFELGLFIGALGRENVCCLLQKDVKERPSDIDGILYKPFDRSVTEIFHEIAEELKEDA
jgi:predicted nucleotide-binding protein